MQCKGFRMWGLPFDLINFGGGIWQFRDSAFWRLLYQVTYLSVCMSSFPHFYNISPISTRETSSLFYPPQLFKCGQISVGVGGGLGMCLTLPITSERSGIKFQDGLFGEYICESKNSKWTLAHQLPFFSVWGRFPSTVIHERLPSACPVYMQEKNQNKLKGIYVSEIL